MTAAALNSHIISSHRNNATANNLKTYICSQCKICSSRRDLYTRRMNQHGGNDDNDPDDIPQYIRNEENENIGEVYITNINHILDYHQEDELRHIYNLNDGYAEIRRHLNEIYDDQNVTQD